MSDFAPIALFIFNRPDHLRRTLTALRLCRGFEASPIHVFADGPKREDQRAAVEAARAVAREMLGDRAVYHFAEANKGLARSVIGGVGMLTESHGRVVVVEDDLELAPGFLEFLNAGLDRYADDDGVMQISGHMFEVPAFAERREAVILPITTTWGWATWARAWRHFDPAATGWEAMRRDAALRRRFNLDGVYDYFTMMERQARGTVDSWGIRWYWSVFRRGGTTVFPPRSLVENKGFDGAGSHGRGWFRRVHSTLDVVATTPIELPSSLDCVPADFAAVRKAIRVQNGGLLGSGIDKIKRLLR